MTKNHYATMVCIYKQRRLRFKKNKIKYAENIRRITRQISRWNKQIREMERRTKRINDLIKSVNEYFGVNIKSRAFDKQHRLARNVYYKFGLENKLEGRTLSLAIGRTQNRRALVSRVIFTKSFRTNKENRKAYADFKRYQT